MAGRRLTIAEFEFLKESLKALEKIGQDYRYGRGQFLTKLGFFGNQQSDIEIVMVKIQSLREVIEKMYE